MPRPAKGPRLWFDKSAGLWFVRDGTIKRSTRCRVGELEEAEKYLADYIRQKHQPLADNRVAAIPVADVLLHYLRVYVPAQKSATASIGAVRALRAFWRDRHLSDVRRSSCNAYVAYRTACAARPSRGNAEPVRTIKLATAARELSILRAAIRAYHAEMPLDALPVVWVPSAQPPRTRWLTRAEAARLLRSSQRIADQHAAQALVRLLLIGLYTGTRSGSMRSLKWAPSETDGWVDLEKGVVHRRGHEEVESKKRRPPVRIPRRLRHAFARWHRMDGPKRHHVIHYAGTALTSLSHAWRDACAAAGLGRDVTVHTLRHTAVTWMLQAGVRPWDVAHYTGMSLQVLETTYAHHHPDFQVEAADIVGRRPVRS